jgi:hypothetical protein
MVKGNEGENNVVPAEGGAKEALDRRIRAARRFLEDLADSGELVRFGHVTVHISEEGLWVEIRKTFK